MKRKNARNKSKEPSDSGKTQNVDKTDCRPWFLDYIKELEDDRAEALNCPFGGDGVEYTQNLTGERPIWENECLKMDCGTMSTGDIVLSEDDGDTNGTVMEYDDQNHARSLDQFIRDMKG